MTNEKYEKVKLLFVDDESENLLTFQLNLEDDFDVITTTSPKRALQLLTDDKNIAMMFVDQVMPELTGMELAMEAKKVNPDVTMVMLTGNATKQLAIESVRTKVFWEFLEKPVDFASPYMKQMIFTGIQESLLHKANRDYREGAIQLVAKLIDDKDGHTHKHSARVQEWSIKLAKKFNLTDHEMMVIRQGALLHDIGKISIPDDILKKPGRLSALERKIIMTHPGRGGDILDSIPQLAELAPLARYHHERHDGKGYPQGLKGDEIPLLSVIVALADFYEALSSKRPYKDPWNVLEIVKEILSQKDKQFPGRVVDAMMEVLVEEGLVTREQILEKERELKAA
jgi:response regulator RpfG family c-di-GMP phosphodiesterase